MSIYIKGMLCGGVTVLWEDTNILEPKLFRLICFSGRIPRLSLIQHSLYVSMIEKIIPPSLTGSSMGKYPEGGH